MFLIGLLGRSYKYSFACMLSNMNKIKPELKIADRMLDLKTLDTNIILNHLDDQIKLRELPINARVKKGLLK